MAHRLQPAQQHPEQPQLVGLGGGHRGQHPLAAGAGGRRVERGQVVDGGHHPGEVGERRGALLEPLRHLVGGGGQLVGAEGLQQGRVGDHGPDVRPRPLVGAGGVEVGPQRGRVHRAVGGRMDPVDVGEGAGGVRPGRDRGHVGAGAEHVAGRADRDQPGPLGHQPVVLAGRQLAGGQVDLGPAHHRPDPGRRLEPGPDVGVVVQAGHHHLVAGGPARGQGGRQPVGEGGHVRAEDDPVGLAADQVGHGPPALGDELVRAPAGREGAAHVADPGPVGAGDGLHHHGRHLGAGGPVQVGVAVGQCRVQRPDPADVPAHRGTPLGFPGPLPTHRGTPSGFPGPLRAHVLTTRTPRGRGRPGRARSGRGGPAPCRPARPRGRAASAPAARGSGGR